MDTPPPQRQSVQLADISELNVQKLLRIRCHFMVLCLGLERCADGDVADVASAAAFGRDPRRVEGRGPLEEVRCGVALHALASVRRHVLQMLQLISRQPAVQSAGGAMTVAGGGTPSSVFLRLHGEAGHGRAVHASLRSVERLERHLRRCVGGKSRGGVVPVEEALDLVFLEVERGNASKGQAGKIRPWKTTLPGGRPVELSRRIFEGIFSTAFVAVSAALTSARAASGTLENPTDAVRGTKPGANPSER